MAAFKVFNFPWCDNDMTMACVACGHKAGAHNHSGDECLSVGVTCTCTGFRKPASAVGVNRTSTTITAPYTNTITKGTIMAETATATKTKLSPGTSYDLPNGKKYIGRMLPGFDDDVTGVRELVAMGKHVFLQGPPGCGKTALFQAAFPDSENDIFHSKKTAYDMLWQPRPMPDGSIQYDPAPLTRAAMKGVPYYGDEIMRAGEDSVTPLFSAMDGRGYIVGGNLDATDLLIAPGFGVVAASNPDLRGAYLPDAITSRFHVLSVETSETLLDQLGLDDRIMTVWRNLSGLNDGEMWVPSIREMLSAQDFANVSNWHHAAYALSGFRVPAKDRSTVAEVISSLFGVRLSAKGGVIL